ncbi:MAG: ADP-ribosylglycohydrolase family protein [Oscillospiraceae bacterium]|nr:ADP-ribosylglycohydrolase family protein [Oscillospiraceae bacterium]
MNHTEKIKGALTGLCAADALGVPVESAGRESLSENPVTDMRGNGAHNQPAGTWSDDTSMTLCLADSLAGGLDYNDIMRKFSLWAFKSEYTPHGKMFGIGQRTSRALFKFSKGTPPLQCGGGAESDNGNGSLMRILPLAFYLRSVYGNDFSGCDEAFDTIHNVSALTHAHARSKIACGIYISVAGNLINGLYPKNGIYAGINEAKEYYGVKPEFASEFDHFSRILSDGFKALPQKDIKSGAYVVETLEAAFWCLLNTSDYESCVLKAVNLGGDADTVAAVAGGLAGICYGCEAIPSGWLDRIARLEFVTEICEKFRKSLCDMSVL